MHQRTRTTVNLVIVFIFVLAAAIYSYQKLKPVPLVTQSEIKALSIKIGADTAEVRKIKGKWELTEINDAPVQDNRLNQGLVNHIVDILKAARALPTEKMDPALMTQYGLADHKLAVSILSEEGEDAVLFGNKDLTGTKVYAFFVKKTLLTQIPSTLLDLLDGKKVEDLRIKTIFTFEPDDVIRLEQAGSGCTKLNLLRDGDHWSWIEGEKISETATDEFLKKLLATKYTDIGKEDAIDKLICSVTLIGLAGKTETVDLLQNKANKITMKSTSLTGYYELEKTPTH